MQPSKEVLPGVDGVTYAADQPQYTPLPTVKNLDNPMGPVTSRWAFTPEERKLIAEGADLFLTLLTFGRPLQPVLMQVFGCGREAVNRLREQGYIPAKGDS